MAVDDDIEAFAKRLESICKLMGPARIDSDDAGDRWIDFKSTGKVELDGQVRSRYQGDNPVWEVVISHGWDDVKTFYVDRREP